MTSNQYAVYAAFPSLAADGLQRSLEVMSEAYLCIGLIINKMKAEIFSTSSSDAPNIPFVGISLKTLIILLTWAQISHFLVTSLIISKDALTLLHQPLDFCVNVCLVAKISRFAQRLLSMMQLSCPPSYVAARFVSNTVVISVCWSLFTSDVSS